MYHFHVSFIVSFKRTILSKIVSLYHFNSKTIKPMNVTIVDPRFLQLLETYIPIKININFYLERNSILNSHEQYFDTVIYSSYVF